MKNIIALSFLLILLNKNVRCQNTPDFGCDTLTALYHQTFEGYTPANGPTGWITSGVDYTQAGFAGFNSTNRIGLNAITDSIITLPLNCPSGISFYWRASGTTSNWGMRVEYSTNLSTWTVLDSVVTTGSGGSTSYTLKSIPFPSGSLLPPFNVRIRFNMYRRTSGAFYMDNLCFEKGTCNAVASELRFNSFTNNCVPSGIPFSTTVCATDNNGYTDTTFNGAITLSLAGGSGSLGGTLTTNAIAGCANFNAATYSGISPLIINASAGALASSMPLTGLDIQTTCPNVDTLKVVTYNVLNFPLGGVYALGGACSVQELGPNRWDTLKYIMEYIKPDVLIVQELQTEAGADSILAKSLNVNGSTNYARAPYIPNKSTANTKYNNEMFYNQDKLVLYQTNTLGTSIRDCGQYILYCKDPLLNVHNDTTFLDVYSVHTKAKGLTAAQATLDSIQRAADCLLIMDSIRFRQSTSRNAVLGGDLNLYTSAEGAYINFTSGLYKFNDPIPLNPPLAENAWESNPVYKALHTQAARTTTRPSLECGARGGLDSRLDFLLVSDDAMTGAQNMQFIPGTYEAFGNDGNLYNRSVDSSSNASGIPFSVLNRLANMSDHIPVALKLAVTYPTLALNINEPLELNGLLQGEKALLNWNYNFETTDFEKVELLRNGKVVMVKSQNFKSNESFTDLDVPNGNNLYQVRITLKNNKIKMSNKLSLFQNRNIAFSISPNPFGNTISIINNNTTTLANEVSLLITNVNGTIMYQNKIVLKEKFDVNTANFPKGLYFVTIQDNFKVKTVKVVK
jgi:hypothetical protein